MLRCALPGSNRIEDASTSVGQTGPMDVPRLLVDPTIGDWVNDRLLSHREAFGQAGAVVPTGFERVIRVLHPTGQGQRGPR